LGWLLLQRENQTKAMQTKLVCADQRWHLQTTGVSMSDYIEIIHPQSMTAKLLCNGVVVEEYKIEQCDKCSQLRRLDQFGYQKGYDRTENIIWFCGGCR